MNKEIKTKWVAALRSGKYKQTTASLFDDSGYCCLGVLCVISRIDTGFGIKENLRESGEEEFLSTTLMAWSGLTLAEGDKVDIEGRSDSLSEHNDSGATFLQIADAIEAQL